MLTLIGVVLAVLVTWGVNPVYSILTLITSALTLGVILLSHGLEFVPFLIVLIYVRRGGGVIFVCGDDDQF